MELLRRDRRPSPVVVLDAQERVDQGRVAEVVGPVRVAQQRTLLLRLFILGVARGALLAFTALRGRLCSTTAWQLLPKEALEPRL